MAFLLTFNIVTAILLASISLYRYGNVPQQHILVTLSVLTSWCFSFLIVFSIPLDVTSTLYRQCVEEHRSNGTLGNITLAPPQCLAPSGMVPAHVFPSLWRIIYWNSQLLTWLIMPLMRSYLKAGDFTVKGKLRTALTKNGITHGTLLFICALLRAYIAVRGEKLSWEKLKAIAASASNTWGLFLHILLLGYALVDVPRSLWNNSNQEFALQYAYFRTAKLYAEKSDAEEHVDGVLESVQCINTTMNHDNELRPCLEAILRKVPVELLVKSSCSFARSTASFTIVPSEQVLVRIHAQVIKALQTLQRAEALWSVQVEQVLHLEDVARNMQSLERRFKCLFPRQRTRLLEALWYSPRMQWYWECRLRVPFLKMMSLLAATMSVLVVWSELTFFCRRPVLSIFANAIFWAKDSNDFRAIEILSTTVLCYFLYCTYSTILRIRFLNLYYLAPHHQTNELSLIFSGMLLCRLTPPMCLNFLGLIHMDTHIIPERIKETAYTQIMGHMDVIGIIANGFNIYFPMCMLVICLATWFSLGSRVLNALSALGFEQFLENESIATELVQEGMDLIAREKRRLQRAEQAKASRRKFRRRQMMFQEEYRSGGGADGGGGPGSRSPTDGLLSIGDRSLDYAAVASSSTSTSAAVLPRFLSTEISDQQFGESSPVQVGFRHPDNVPMQETTFCLRRSPPRRLFDDV